MPSDSSLVDGDPPDGIVDASLTDAMPDAPPAIDPWAAIDGLIARYPMDDNPALTGRLESNDPTAVGTCDVNECPTSIVGINGGGYSFDGDQRAVIMKSSLITSAPYTVSLWAWIDPTTPPYALIFSKPLDGISNQNMFGVGINTNQFVWESSDGDYVVLSAPQGFDPYEGWHHYALQWNGNRKRLYIDGQPTTSQPTNMLDSSLPFSLGADVDFGVPNGYVVARIDELRIYSRSLDSNEIVGLATSSGL